MDIHITLDLEAAIGKAASTERLAPILDKALTEAITQSIQNATGYNSEFRKSVQQQLTTALPHGLTFGDVAKFQQVINQKLVDLVYCANKDTIAVALEKVASMSMLDVPAKMKMSELIKLYRDSLHIEAHEAFYAHYETSDIGYGHLYLNDERGLKHSFSKYSAPVRVAFNREGTVYSLALDGKQITPASRPNIVSQFEDAMLAMYVGRTSIVVDMDADQVEEAAAGNGD